MSCARIPYLLPLREKVSAKPTDEGSKDASNARVRKASARQARALRQAQPTTERSLWKLLRDRRLANLKFRRQVPLGPYIVDFACLSRRLVVEADGPFHDLEADAVRDAWLASQGFRVLRFSNSEVAAKDLVLGRILEAASAAPPKRPLDPSSVTLRVTPSPARGEGGW
jgi:very-short-patch-repair endonuclease